MHKKLKLTIQPRNRSIYIYYHYYPISDKVFKNKDEMQCIFMSIVAGNFARIGNGDHPFYSKGYEYMLNMIKGRN